MVTSDKLKFPVRFDQRGEVSVIKGPDGHPLFEVRGKGSNHTRYVSSAITRALNAYHHQLNAVKDLLGVIDSMKSSLGIDPIQQNRIEEIEKYQEFLQGKRNHANQG